MNPIRQALHSAARHYATEAHTHWIQANDYANREFCHALAGRDVARRKAAKFKGDHIALYYQLLSMAHNAREMMK